MIVSRAIPELVVRRVASSVIVPRPAKHCVAAPSAFQEIVTFVSVEVIGAKESEDVVISS